MKGPMMKRFFTVLALLAVTLFGLGITQSSRVVSAQTDTKALAQAWVDAENTAITSGDTTALLALYAPDFADPMLPPGANALDNVKQSIAQIHTGFPDGKLTVKDIIASDTKAAVYTTVSGTNNGVFAGVAATGKAFTDVAMVDLLTFKDGKISQDINVTDSASLLSQLGWNINPPGGAGAMMTPPATMAP
jgi:steroid delta-isomerase-like uncharacterized protein